MAPVRVKINSLTMRCSCGVLSQWKAKRSYEVALLGHSMLTLRPEDAAITTTSFLPLALESLVGAHPDLPLGAVVVQWRARTAGIRVNLTVTDRETRNLYSQQGLWLFCDDILARREKELGFDGL